MVVLPSRELWIRGSELVKDTSVATWAQDRQSGDVRRTDFQVPSGFDKYCRIFHRVPDLNGELKPWSSFATAVDFAITDRTHWHSIAQRDDSLRWIGPIEGVLDKLSASEFLALLCGRVPLSTTLIAGFWRGSTRFQGSTAELPTVKLGLRENVLFRVTLSTLSGIDEEFPGILWPEDMSWYLSTDIDYDSTIVGGTSDFIDSIMMSSSIEAVVISPDLDLTHG